MKGKRGNFKIAYNMQSAVDSETGLICAITISQSPTDHYELPSIVSKAIKNIGKKPEYVSADTIHLQNPNVSFLIEQKINGLIPDRKQSKKARGRLNKNPFHKDHFEYNIYTDSFKCPANQELPFYKEYIKESNDKSKSDKINRLYSNYHACKNCKYKNKCIPGKQSHRTITENGDRLIRAMYVKMEKEENQKEYKKRSTVERPFGPLKIQYNMEDEIVIGIEDTECYMTLNAVAYNINRLYNLLYDKKNHRRRNIKL